MSNALIPDRITPVSQLTFEQSYGKPELRVLYTRCHFLIILSYRRNAHLLHDHACAIWIVCVAGASFIADRRLSFAG